jgi:hypothetical protein
LGAFPPFVGPGRWDVSDLFASFWLDPKRRGMAPKQHRLVNEPTLFPNNG